MICSEAIGLYRFGSMTVSANFSFTHATPIDPVAGAYPDVSIELTRKDETPKSPFYHDDHIIAGDQDFYFRVSDALAFRIRNGAHISIYCSGSAGESDIMLYLVGSAWGVLCHQRGLLPFHCSAIGVGNNSIALTGASGAGKSTLAAGLMCRGYSHICDDVGVLRPKANTVCLHPLEKGLKLWADAANTLNLPRGRRAGTDPAFDKYFVDTNSRLAQSELPLKEIFVLHESQSREFSVSVIRGTAKFDALLSNIYRSEWLPLLRKPGDVFQDIQRLLPSLRIFRFTRPRDLGLLDDSISFLETHLDSYAETA